MKLKPLILLAVLTFTVFSCDDNEKFLYTSSSSFKEIIQLSKENKKGTILLLGSEKCNICDALLSDINNDENYKKEIGKNYIVARTNIGTKDSQWIFGLLERIATPTFLIFDKQQNLTGYIAGYKNKEEFRLILNQIEQRKCEVSEINLKSLNYPVSKENLLQAFEDVFKAQFLLTDTGKKKNSSQIKELLNSSLDRYPSIYTRYLLANFYKQQDDSILSKQIAMQALDSCNLHPEQTRYLFIKDNLYKLINPNHHYRDEAFFETSNSHIQIGEAITGAKNNITIPYINGGKKDLKLIQVHGDCSCTTINYSPETIPPGGKGEINLTLTPDQEGDFTRKLIVVSNGINSPCFINLTGTSK